eukprot:scaffold880_cov132-Cylindrotheca_fusiformis.AAC.25
MKVVVGHITGRRCIGKHLTFADIQVEECGEKVQVIFQRDSSVWNMELNDSFPTKNSKLPYGAKVSVELCSVETDHGISWVVKSWEMLVNPREEALRVASQSDGQGISCSDYLKSRGKAFLRYNETMIHDKETKKNHIDEVDRKSEAPKEGFEFCHGDNHAKSMRARVFARWLIETYGSPRLQQGSGVLDIAGGKGKLSIELSLQGKIPCTIVDPLVRKHGKRLNPREAKRIRKAEAPHPNLISLEFNTTTFPNEYHDLICNSSILIGIHPDEPTEDILDLALKYQKPVAIVPCCVFPGFFPMRVLPCGTAVRTYDQFLNYLLAKDDRLKLETLPFEGRNQVIYLPL